MAAAATPSLLQLRRPRLVGAALRAHEGQACAVARARWRPATLTLSISCTRRNRWVISSTVTVRRDDLVAHRVVQVGPAPGRRRRRRAWPRTAASGAGRRRGAAATRPGAGSPCRPCGRPRRAPGSRRRRATRRLRSTRSIRRPGVATTTSTPVAQRRRSAGPCGRRRRRRRPVRSTAAPSGSSTSVTWRASSRVGTSTSARGARRLGLRRRGRGAGRPKASVLPEPVLALPQTSRPARASGIVRAWMGKAVSMPPAPRAATRAVGHAEFGE